MASATAIVDQNFATPTAQIAPPLNAPVCGSTGNSLSATITDADLYQWTASSNDNTWIITSNHTTNPITYTAGSGTQGKFVLVVTNTQSGCTASDSISLNCTGANYCARTQGFFGNNGKFCDGRDALTLLHDLLATPMTIGAGSKTVTFFQADAACLQGKLPMGSGPAAFTANFGTCAHLTQENTLIAQTIVLSLSKRLSPTLGSLVIQDNCLNTLQSSSCNDPAATPVPATFASHCLPSSIMNYFGGPYTVNQLLTLANNALGGVYVPGAGQPTLGDIESAEDALVNSFDQCNFLTGFTPTQVTPQTTGINDTHTNGVIFSMFPNPANDDVNIRFSSVESGQAEVKVFDISGKIVADVFAGNVDADVAYQFNVSTSNFEKAVYVVQVTCNKQTTNGKLIITH